jgi:hypothetical protein
VSTTTLIPPPPAGSGQAPPGSSPAPASAASPPAAISDSSGRAINLNADQWARKYREPSQSEIARLRQSSTYQALRRCFPRWQTLPAALSEHARRALIDGRPVDPNDPDTWKSRFAHTQAVLRRHNLHHISPDRLTANARQAVRDSQREADQAAAINWSAVSAPDPQLDRALKTAHATPPIDLSQPGTWVRNSDRTNALAGLLGIDARTAEELSPLVQENPECFDTNAAASWLIATPNWLRIASEQVDVPAWVQRPVGLFLTPDARSGGWVLTPVLSLAMLLTVHEFGGQIDRGLASFEITFDDKQKASFLERISHATLSARRRKPLETPSAHAEAASAELGAAITPRAPSKLDEWGRLEVVSWGHGTYRFQVVTHAQRALSRRAVGARYRFDPNASGRRTSVPSARMEIGEAVGIALDSGLPLLLSAEALGALAGHVRVGRLKGRPGLVAITSIEGMSASTERMVIDCALGTLRRLKAEQRPVVVDSGARQLIRMATVKPLADDPILFAAQQKVAAIMAVGSGVNASQTGTGKTILTGRALAHRAATKSGFRGILVARGRLLPQWRSELLHGAPPRLPAVAPQLQALIIDERSSVSAQLRQFHRQLGDAAGLVMVSDGILERHLADLKLLDYDLLVADEGHNYANPATGAARALRELRMTSVADAWINTGTPTGTTAESLDILVGLAVGDEEMIDSRPATREAGNLLEEDNAHRLRLSYGPHVVCVTRHDLRDHIPRSAPAQPLPVSADPALSRLLEAIREGGRRAYQTLVQLLGDLKTLEHGSELYMRALAEIGRAQGHVLGNVGVFLDASVDPETLVHSRAALAQALVRDGVVGPAVAAGGRGEPTLRAIVADTLADFVAQEPGEQMLVFADRVRCLRQLAGSVQARGVDCRVADGQLNDEEFERLKMEFQAGAFPVLCVSEVAQEGHNLQSAGNIIHLDLPWVPRKLEQRVGRVLRLGSRHNVVRTWIPYIELGAIPYQVGILAPRGGQHHQIFEGFEDVPLSESTIAGQLGEITAQAATAKDDEGYRLTAARLRVAAAVFGH